MKKLLFIIGLGVAMAIASCNTNEKTNEDSVKIADLTEEYKEATSFNDSLLLLMGDIYAGVDSINQQEGLLYTSGGDNADRRAEIRQNLQTIKSRLAANRQILSEMETKLANSTSQNKVHLKTIQQLKATIERQEAQIAQLESDLTKTKEQLAAAHTEINNLNEQVTETQEQVKVETAAKEQAQAQATEAENMANRVYFCIGSNKELKANGLLEKKFLGRTKVMEGNFNSSYFTAADRRTLSEIPTGAKKASIKTNQPKDSYQIVDNANGTKTIKILSPTKFWQTTPYCVIEVKN